MFSLKYIIPEAVLHVKKLLLRYEFVLFLFYKVSLFMFLPPLDGAGGIMFLSSVHPSFCVCTRPGCCFTVSVVYINGFSQNLSIMHLRTDVN